MGCSGGCGGARAVAAAKYPKTIELPDGTKVEVTSSSDEYTQRQQAYVRMRSAGKGKGYTAKAA